MKFGITKRNNSMTSDPGAFRYGVDRLFDEFFNLKPVSLFDSEWLPAIDVYEDEKHIHIKADVAGIEEKDLDLNLQDNVLTVSGKRNEEKKESSGKNCFVSERRFGSFSRSIALPEGINPDSVKAELKNGVLKVSIEKPKIEESKKIKIGIN